MVSKFLQSIAGKSVIVTGGASGLGAATARLLASEGMKVTVADMNAELGEKVAAEIKGVFCKTDVSSEESVKALIKKADSEHGPLYSTVHCAAILLYAKVLGEGYVPHSQADFNKIVNVNLNGTFNINRLSAEQMAKRKAPEGEDSGVIINCASIAGCNEGQIYQAAYAASKGGVIALTSPLAREFAAYKIRVNAIAPGGFMTPMACSVTQSEDEVNAMAKDLVPYPTRFGRPGEFAALVQHVIMNQYINGEVIRIDGATRLPFTRM